MDASLLKRLNEERRQRRAAIVTTRLSDGAQRLIREREIAGDPQAQALSDALRRGRSGTVELADGATFLNIHLPPPRILLVGAVHISQVLAPMARLAGYDVSIVDPRTGFASPERFPDIELAAEWPDIALRTRPLDAYTGLAALTHDPKIDDLPLIEALRAGCFYVGALGSRKTHGRRVERLREAGLDEASIARIDAPIGVDIGSSTPGEIAVSVLAAIVSAFRRRDVEARAAGGTA